jgi:UDP-N-acetylglucosamine 4,6-dehydratase
MCPQDDSHLTLGFHDHYVIKPTISFAVPVDFALNNIGEQGTPVAEGFEYSSGTNTDFINVEQIRAMIKSGVEA